MRYEPARDPARATGRHPGGATLRAAAVQTGPADGATAAATGPHSATTGPHSIDEAKALDKALAAEHAAVYAYGVVAARSKGRTRRTATAAFDAHRARRDRLRGMIKSRGGTPPEAEAAYSLPVVPRSERDAVDLALDVEDGITAAYIELAAVNDPSIRELAALAVQESATRRFAFRPEIPTALPGLQ
ncbi:protein of unknown function [Sinosporangium album]|uniref:DUF4439 domain-containing protein n=1 Tax=Sinosporangium album TaxID=504805 RepID=A0A1G7RUX5_9ACTN|nr:ferritin-like domain-containing protein [Sinosporangium album]SDG14617.1 protein of unknown function [Sinosporangium album]